MNQFETSPARCAYCNGCGPFNDEHVFPAGLGGNDRAFLLKNIVCMNCNTGIFSKFEGVLMRKSLVSLGRIAYQPHGRTKRDAPVFEPVENGLVSDDGDLLEAGYKKGFNVAIHPQIIIYEDKIKFIATEAEELNSFFSNLEKTLNTEKTLIVEELNTGAARRYNVHTFTYSNDTFVSSETTNTSKPPKNSIWLRSIPEKTANRKPFDGILYSDRPGNLSLKLSDKTKVDRFLNAVHKALPKISKDPEHYETSITEHPLISTTFLGWSQDCDRAVAKIAFNFLIFECSPIVRDRAFAKIKRSILTGTPKLPLSLKQDDSLSGNIFARPPENHHVVLLHPLDMGKGRSALICMMLLYGTTLTSVTLAEKTSIRTLPNPVYYTIDYINHRINRLSLVEYHRRYNPDLGSFFRL